MKVRGERGEHEAREHDPSLLAAYLEDRLDPSERGRFTEHLARCAECRDALALLARAGTEAELLPLPVSLDPGWPRPATLTGQGPARTWRALRNAWLPLAATVVLTAAVVGRLGGPDPDQGGGSSPGPSEAPPRATQRPPADASPPQGPPGGLPKEPGPPGLEDGLLVKRAATRQVAGKTFRLVAGEWIDSSFDAASGLPIVEVRGPEELSRVLARIPSLAAYARVGERVRVVFQGTVYRFSP